MDTRKIIREFLIKELKDNGFREGIKDDESLMNAEVMDSLGILITINFLQERFGIIINEDELNTENFDSIIALSKFVESKIAKQNH